MRRACSLAPTSTTSPLNRSEVWGSRMPGLVSKVRERVYCVAAPFGVGGLVHCYLIDAPRRTIVDTGTAPVPQESLLPALRELDWDTHDLRYIVNTHMHGDHTGGNAEMKELS